MMICEHYSILEMNMILWVRHVQKSQNRTMKIEFSIGGLHSSEQDDANGSEVATVDSEMVGACAVRGTGSKEAISPEPWMPPFSK